MDVNKELSPSPSPPAREAGILLHISSLPGAYGIGELGPGSIEFLDFLQASGQSCWQFLPLGPTSAIHGHSPYMSPSAFAGNPLLISPQGLLTDGLLTTAEADPAVFTNEASPANEAAPPPGFDEYLVNFKAVVRHKNKILRSAFACGLQEKKWRDELAAFRAESFWLDDYALFAALSDKFAAASWQQWPAPLARREPEALAAARRDLAAEIDFHAFSQLLFQRQWQALKTAAAERGIKLIADLPIYVALNSADVWACRNCYQIDESSLQPEFIAGVPPDYFSPTGQNWGNPLYRWPEIITTDDPVINWWRQRFSRQVELADVVRIDHFRAFEAYWRIPAAAETAIDGDWISGPGAAFFEAVGPELDGLEIIAEDLGIITPGVEQLRDQFGFAGMKVLQFAFDEHYDNLYLPWNFTTPNCVVYSGTHDNNTSVGWYLDPQTPEKIRDQFRRVANSDGSSIHHDMLRLAYASIARRAVIPLQDALGFGADCRMNCPGSTTRNWAWRCAPRFLTAELAASLRREVIFYNRQPQEMEKKGV